jgi:alpha-beta hydrolase superfamily lysophospholipase
MTPTTATRGTGDDLIFSRTWTADQAVATVVLVHGINEHTGRYNHVGAQFNESNLTMTGSDLPGFGESGGPRAHIDSWDQFLDAVEHDVVEAKSAGLPVVLYGHSMGGLISLSYALSDRAAPDLLILSAPALDADVPKWQRLLAPIISKVAPKLGIPAGINGEALSRDDAVGEAYFADPLRTPKDSAMLGALLFEEMERAQANAASLDLTTYVIHGGADPLVLPQFSAPLGELPTVERKLYPALRHETHNEPEQREVIAETIDWILGNLPAS